MKKTKILISTVLCLMAFGGCVPDGPAISGLTGEESAFLRSQCARDLRIRGETVEEEGLLFQESRLRYHRDGQLRNAAGWVAWKLNGSGRKASSLAQCRVSVGADRSGAAVLCSCEVQQG